MKSIFFLHSRIVRVVAISTLAVLLTLFAPAAPIAHAATCTVTNANDSGSGSLHEKIGDVTCDTINFNGDYTIHLASQLTINRNMTIDGIGHNVTLSGDTNDDGVGNVRPIAVNYSSTLYLNRLTVTKGYADWGGGVIVNTYQDYGGTFVATNVTFSDNRAIYAGGAIYNMTNSTSHGTVTVSNSTFVGNSTTDAQGSGGGIYNRGALNVTNSTLTGSIGYWGGAIFNDSFYPVIILNSTFSGNSSFSGAGSAFYNVTGSSDSPVTLKNDIFTHSLEGLSCWWGGQITKSNNLQDVGDNCWSTESPYILLGPLGNYGGSTQTMPLLPGSAAIDAGNDATCAAAPVSNLDQRGISRSGFGTHCDIGAFESRGFTVSNVTGTPQSTYVNTAFAAPLGLTVTANNASEPTTGGKAIFTIPGSGASVIFTGNPTIDLSGVFAAPVSANGVPGGPYTIVANVAGAPGSFNYSLTNNCVPAMTVSNANDSSVGSLRHAILGVCANGTIAFDSDYSIRLASQLTIDKNMTINHTGRNVTLSGDTNNNGISDAGDVRVLFVNPGVTVNLNQLTITKGLAWSTDFGGGLYNSSGSNTTLTNSTLSSNRGFFGGAIYNEGTLTVTNSTISGNNAQNGGGIANYGTTTLRNSTLYGNSALSGGAVLNSTGALNLANSTLSGNSASENFGSGIENFGAVNMTNSIVANSAQGTNCYAAGVGGAYNLVDDASCVWWQASPSAILLGTFGNYGGGTMTVPLLPGSVAIDATSHNCPTTDQRGVTRSSPTCDIGAFESRGFAFSNLTGTPQSTPINHSYATPLGLTVTANNASEPINGGRVILTAPASGASITVSPITLTIASGTVSQTVVAANGIFGGPYNVVASSAGAPSVNFILTNSFAPTVTVTSSLNPSTYGQSVTFTATVATGSMTATGTVTFRDNGNPISACGTNGVVALDGSGRATCTLSTLSAGSHPITAPYSGDANYPSNISNTVTQSVSKRLITVKADSKTKEYGTPDPPLTFQVTSGSLAPGDTFSGSLVRPAGENVGAYTIQQGTLTAGGNYTLTFVQNWFWIDGANVTVILTSSHNPSAPGQAATFTATVTSAVGGSAPTFDSLRGSGRAPRSPRYDVPSGTVTFKDNGINIAGCVDVALNGAGLATCTTTTLAIGSHTITALYSGDLTNYNYKPGSGTITQNVNNPVPTITSISPTSAAVNAPDFTLTVTGTNFIASSYVEWNSNALTTTYVSSTKLTAIVPKSLLTAAGAASVEVYNPPGYESNSASFTITAANATVTVVLTSSCNPCYQNFVTITATVTNTVSASGRVLRSPRDAVPTGTMTFKDGSNNVASCVNRALNGAGQAICATTLAGGTHTITAQYSGDANFNLATGTLTQKVNYLIILPRIMRNAPY